MNSVKRPTQKKKQLRLNWHIPNSQQNKSLSRSSAVHQSVYLWSTHDAYCVSSHHISSICWFLKAQLMQLWSTANQPVTSSICNKYIVLFAHHTVFFKSTSNSLNSKIIWLMGNRPITWDKHHEHQVHGLLPVESANSCSPSRRNWWLHWG